VIEPVHVIVAVARNVIVAVHVNGNAPVDAIERVQGSMRAFAPALVGKRGEIPVDSRHQSEMPG
jgi:hypothetical protein